TVTLSTATSAAEVNQAMRAAAAGDLRGILAVADEPLVSIDYAGNSNSSILDAPLTLMSGDRLLKVLAWYDNEWGYSCRVADLAELVVAELA
ncbi:Glyceraldehyde 3-phosphate dehydrogenase, partial [mine drainage metagenome]